MGWENDTKWESDWWGTCQNTFGEEEKQIKYAELMGLKFVRDDKTLYNIDMMDKSVLDIGGGPVSLLLKCKNVKGTIVDPCEYPEWVNKRYELAGIDFEKVKGEDINIDSIYDESWIYNVLQHTQDIEKLVENVIACSKIIRVFEWLDGGVSPGHPNNLTKGWLDKLFNGEGQIKILNEKMLRGKSYYGIFRAKHHADE